MQEVGRTCHSSPFGFETEGKTDTFVELDSVCWHILWENITLQTYVPY